MCALRESPGGVPSSGREKRKKRAKRRLQLPRVPHQVKLFLMGIAALVFFGLGGIVVWASLVPIPAINNFQNQQIAQSTKIYDRTGNVLLYDVHGEEQRTAVNLDQISPYLQNATIATEDDTFYSNIGIQPTAMIRAFFVDLFSRSYAQGASTITQQVVKNDFLTQDKTLPRKIEEIILALRLTRAYSKDQILNAYLNDTNYGGTIYGVQEASQYYFGVDASNLDLAQAAYLAALPQAPTYYSPYGSNVAELTAREQFILGRMLSLGMITQDEYNQAANEQVQFKSEAAGGILAPHFVFYILQQLEQQFGDQEVEDGGLSVITTLDYSLQEQMQNDVDQYGPEMEQNFNASNVGVVAIDPKTGQILGMIGSENYFDDAIDGQVNVTLANRQPGSTFKPFVYATAFEEGYTPDTVLFDVPTQFSTDCLPSQTTDDTPPCFSPSNYDGTFKGPMTMRDAIAQSENVPSVKVEYLAGVANSVQTAEDLGITTLGNPEQYGLTLVLGGGDVNLLEMTGAYAVFADSGIKNTPTGILQVTDSTGKVLESYQSQPTQVLDPQIAAEINDVLSDNVARAPEFGTDGPLEFDGYDVADKTGTTNDTRDAWVIGYTPSIVVGSWAGNNDNSPMSKKIAAFILAPLWHQIMAYAIQQYPAPSFTPPAPNPDLGSLPPVLTGDWDTNPAEGIHDILYWVQRTNPLAGPPADPAADPQEPYWDYAAQQWAEQNPELVAQENALVEGSGAASTTAASAPQVTTFEITAPQAGASVSSDAAIPFTAAAPTGAQVTSVTYYVNGQNEGSATTPPYSVSYLPDTSGTATLKAVAALQGGGELDATLTFTIQQ